MKLLTLIFCSICYLGYSQVIFRMEMNVREVQFDTTRCHRNVRVLWGIKDDTICFIYGEKARCFYPLSRKSQQKIMKTRDRLLTWSHLSKPGDKHFIMQDKFNELYHVRIVSLKEGKFVIFVVNMEYGTPNYVFGWKCSECN